MICPRCCHAADNRLGPEHHCDATGGPGARCDCQHRETRRCPAPTGCQRPGECGYGCAWAVDELTRIDQEIDQEITARGLPPQQLGDVREARRGRRSSQAT